MMQRAATPTPSQAELDALLKGIRLRFPEPMETAFREDYNRRWLTTNRAAFAGGILLIAVFGVVDVWAAPHHLATILFLRYAVCCTITVGLLLFSFSPTYLRLMQPLGTTVVIVVGCALVMMDAVIAQGEPGFGLYIFGVPIVIVFAYTAPRLRFPYALTAGTVLAAVSIVVAVADGALRGNDAPVRFLVTEGILLATNLIGMLAGYFIESGLRSNYMQQLILEQERQRSDALLLNILPAPVAERLKRGESVVDGYDEVTVLFADLVGFTPMSAEMSPQALVTFLNQIFSRFDRLAEDHTLEKIKTIGDAYLAVGGMPVPRSDHAERVARFAMDMQKAIDEVGARQGVPVRLRIGMHTGPVVAGVIGLRKFSYDLWGDTVNTASRMESHGEPGRIHVSDASHERLKDRFAFEGPVLVNVKGKGEMQTYYLVGER